MKAALFGSAALAALACLTATSAFADEAAATGEASAVQEIVVYGQGETRQTQTIKTEEIQHAVPGVSPIKIVEKLPGVNFQSADAFGAYEWSTRISIRGFNQNQLGFTLDGVPLGDMSYGNFNGLHISRAIASEDIGQVQLAQGTGALDIASTSNLGGALKFVSRDPSHEMGGLVSATVGSDAMHRFFGRFETGDLPTGGRAYLSVVDQKTDKWKGQGQQKQRQVDFKFVQPLGDATLTGFYDWSHRRENDYQDMSLGMLSRLGYDWDNLTGHWATAVAVANTYLANPGGDCTTNAYPAPIKCVDDAYYDAAGLRNDTLWGLTLNAPVGERLQTRLTVYGHRDKGQGVWFSPYVPSPNYGVPGATSADAPISVRTTEYTIHRLGAVADATYAIGDHTIGFGGWLERNDFTQARRFYALDLAGPRSSLDFMTNPFATQWAYAYTTKTSQGYLQDTWAVNDALKINAGFKAVKVAMSSETQVGSPVINGEITSRDGFLPQAGATFRVNENNELFAGFAKNMRAFGAAHTGLSPFATTQEGFNAIKGNLKPETSKTYEAGWRFRTGEVQGVAAVYYVKFDNRLIGTSAGAGIVGNPTILANAGSVTAKGFETAATWNITSDWALFGSYAYNESTYDDDIIDPTTGAVSQHISGKQTVDTPKHLAQAEVSYAHGGWYAKLAAHYTSERFFTYTNDKKVPSATVADFSAGYTFDGPGLTKGLEVQVNVTNLFDKQYVSTLGSNGFGYSGDAQTLLPGAPRQAFVTVRKSF